MPTGLSGAALEGKGQEVTGGARQFGGRQALQILEPVQQDAHLGGRLVRRFDGVAW
jgi:hypothetical protein